MTTSTGSRNRLLPDGDLVSAAAKTIYYDDYGNITANGDSRENG